MLTSAGYLCNRAADALIRRRRALHTLIILTLYSL